MDATIAALLAQDGITNGAIYALLALALVLVFAVTITAATGLAFGVLPALRAFRDGASRLREGSRAGVGGRKERLRSALVVAEVSLSVALLITSGLLIRALWRLNAIDPGFQQAGVLTLRTALPTPKYEKGLQREAFYQRVLIGVRALGQQRIAAISNISDSVS